MKSVYLVTLAFTLPLAVGGAAVPAQLGVSSDLRYASDYVFRGIRTAEESFQPTLEVVFDDFYGGIWANVPTGREESEIRYYGGVGLEIPDLDFLDFDLGATVRDNTEAGADRTHEFYLGARVRFPERPEVGGSLYYFYDADLRSHVGEAKATYTRSLERIGLPAALDFSVLAGVRGGGVAKARSYHYYGGSIELPWMLGPFGSVTAGAHYAAAEKATLAPGEGKDTFFWTIGYTTYF